MPGIIGGTVDARPLSAMCDAMTNEDWYETAELVGPGASLGLVHHGKKDEAGHTVWEADGRRGVIHGVVSNRESLGLTEAEILERTLADPEAVLAALSGPFLLAVTDGERTIVATDKLATRPCYYARTDGLVFASELKALLGELTHLRLDVRAVGDLLLLGYVIGRKTLLENVETLRPGTYLEHGDGETTVRSYWNPSFAIGPTEGFLEESVRKYRQVIRQTATTMDGRVGLWLSGGLDSRTMAAALREEVGEFTTVSYRTTHSGRDRRTAKRVAEALGVEHRYYEQSPERFVDAIETGVDLMDGMNQWSFYVNLPAATAELPDRIDIMMEASGQGEFFGDVMNRHYLTAYPPAQAIHRLKGQLSPEEVRSLLAMDVDPMASIQRLADTSTHDRREFVTTETLWEVFADSHFRGNRLYRSQAGTRVPFADGEFLDHVARLPFESLRIGAVPFTNGSVPTAVSPLKLGVARRVSRGTDHIPYERTRLPPRYPLAAHVLGFVGDNVVKRARESRISRMGQWYRENQRVRQFVDGLLADACERPLFDEQAVWALRDEHVEGEADHIKPISAVTTLELWRQRHLDGEDVEPPTGRVVRA